MGPEGPLGTATSPSAGPTELAQGPHQLIIATDTV